MYSLVDVQSCKHRLWYKANFLFQSTSLFTCIPVLRIGIHYTTFVVRLELLLYVSGHLSCFS